MARTAKPKKAKPKTAERTDSEQSERFIQAAKDLGIEETGAAFDEAVNKITPPRERPSNS